MNIDFITNKWIPALRSGEYEQGTGTLRTVENQFCCLGVACDLIIKEDVFPEVDWLGNENGWNYSVPSYWGSKEMGYQTSAALPSQFSEWIGLPGDGGFIEMVGAVADYLSWAEIDPDDDTMIYIKSITKWVFPNLMSMNDEARLTFDQIADVLEAIVAVYQQEGVELVETATA